MADIDIAARMNAANAALKAKGYTFTSVAIGGCVISDGTISFQATVTADGSDQSKRNWQPPATLTLGNPNYTDPGALMDAIDTAIAAAPAFSQDAAVVNTALAKLTPDEIAALGIDPATLIASVAPAQQRVESVGTIS